MKQHVVDLYEHVRAGSGAESRADEWHSVMRRVRQQLPLRVVSCCRIAAQLVDDCQVVYRTLSLLHPQAHP